MFSSEELSRARHCVHLNLIFSVPPPPRCVATLIRFLPRLLVPLARVCCDSLNPASTYMDLFPTPGLRRRNAAFSLVAPARPLLARPTNCCSQRRTLRPSLSSAASLAPARPVYVTLAHFTSGLSSGRRPLPRRDPGRVASPLHALTKARSDPSSNSLSALRPPGFPRTAHLHARRVRTPATLLADWFTRWGAIQLVALPTSSTADDASRTPLAQTYPADAYALRVSLRHQRRSVLLSALSLFYRTATLQHGPSPASPASPGNRHGGDDDDTPDTRSRLPSLAPPHRDPRDRPTRISAPPPRCVRRDW
ncbi:hypothetical protein CERSUDRAFT_101226 [Gelatoporia subvermispora B]|uniref:Uncharacterized protein n=1 Tax=Ceriporiopsis subvermispora (strain B) TaxID=914234 RepID=M2Q175_CERS8|nr:hypothetical protein CERSUDRAFT_101226 [Gelatoporia subvermispora B]